MAHLMTRFHDLALLLAAWGAALPAAGGEPWDRDWVEVRTEHFVIESALSEHRTLELASDLEGSGSAPWSSRPTGWRRSCTGT